MPAVNPRHKAASCLSSTNVWTISLNWLYSLIAVTLKRFRWCGLRPFWSSDVNVLGLRFDVQTELILVFMYKYVFFCVFVLMCLTAILRLHGQLSIPVVVINIRR